MVPSSNHPTPPTKPDPQSYQLPLLSHITFGVYPGHFERPQALARVRAYHQAGVSCFIDLTEERDGLHPYMSLFPEVLPAGGTVPVHLRLPLRDQSAPSDPGDMIPILDALDDAVATGHQVYLHCWGGIGRTGMVAGCYLVRHGLTGEMALREVARLFSQTPRGQEGRRAPENDTQRRFVLHWSGHDPKATWPPAETAPVSERDRFRGCLLGLAAGDALGTTLEFRKPGSFQPIDDMIGGGPFQLEAGQWTDDTSMALCLACSLTESGRMDLADQMARYCRWWESGYCSSTGTCFDIGNTVRASLGRFKASGDPLAGSASPSAAGNGSLMRLAPVPMFWHRVPGDAVANAAWSSRTTHAAPEAVDACRYAAALLLGALRGVPRDELLSPTHVDRLGFWYHAPLEPRILAIARGSYRDKNPPAIRGGDGYVVDTLEAALWALHHSHDFRSGALLAVNLGGDADTTGAVYGQLAGAIYGAQAIPAEWLARLAEREQIEKLADQLHGGPAGLHPARQIQAERYARQLIAESGGDMDAAVREAGERANSASLEGPQWAGRVWELVVEMLARGSCSV